MFLETIFTGSFFSYLIVYQVSGCIHGCFYESLESKSKRYDDKLNKIIEQIEKTDVKINKLHQQIVNYNKLR
jgi:hypothetical protein